MLSNGCTTTRSNPLGYVLIVYLCTHVRREVGYEVLFGETGYVLLRSCERKSARERYLLCVPLFICALWAGVSVHSYAPEPRFCFCKRARVLTVRGIAERKP